LAWSACDWFGEHDSLVSAIISSVILKATSFEIWIRLVLRSGHDSQASFAHKGKSFAMCPLLLESLV
jgi:hypothetical protein